MRRMMKYFALAAVLTLPLYSASCLKEKIIQIVIGQEASADFFKDDASETFETPDTLDLCGALDDALAEAGLSRDDIVKIVVLGAYYGAVTLGSPHDWTISGEVSVARQDLGGSDVTAITYTSQSVAAALGKKIKAPLTTPSVDLLQAAANDWLTGASPILVAKLKNGTARSPQNTPPDASDRIIFSWRLWVKVQVVLEDSVELPDPF